MDEGSLLHERYRIAETLGRGGMGAVYRAIDDTLGVQVAVKENLFDDEEYVRQFRREATILANLRHSNLPRVTDHFVIQNQGQYLVMDYIEGEDLKDRLERMGVLHQSEVTKIGVAILDALQYLHTHNPSILHRDIKPGNIKISPDGKVFLVDFGLVKIVSGNSKTTVGAQGLTPGYSPPEQYGSARTDERSDIYSLGATLYVALAGVPPEDSLSRMMEQTKLTGIREHNPNVSEEIAKVIEKSLEVQPEDRYQRAEDFREALLQAGDTAQRRVMRDDTSLVPPPAGDDETRVVGKTLPISSGKVTIASRNLDSKSGLKRLPLIVISLFVLGALTLITLFVLPIISGESSDGITNADGGDVINSTVDETIIVTESPNAAGEEKQTTPDFNVTSSPSFTATIATTPVGGGGGEIAFASDRSGIPQIWKMNIDGTNLIQLTDNPGGACQPDWAPDGNRLVFVSPCPRNQSSYPGSSLFVINADGSGLTSLPAFPGGDYDPAWSPDGSKIAFTSLRDFGRPQIWALDLDTNGIVNISNNVARDFHPVWSPDGNMILFVTTRSGESQIWFMDSSGNSQNFFSRSDEFSNSEPIWSPDGQVIIFTQRSSSSGITWLSAATWEEGWNNRGFNEFYTIGDESERIRNPMREPDYSPDGFWLVVVNNTEGDNHDIYIMTTSGASLQRLTTDPATDFDPAWRPITNTPN